MIKRLIIEGKKTTVRTIAKNFVCGERSSASAKEAIRTIEEGFVPDLLFTDVVMPDMTGAELAAVLSGRYPELKVLFTTGYTRNAIVHNGMLDAGKHLLSKPFAIEDLAAKVRALLDEV